MLNPKDLEMLDDEEQRKEFDTEFLAEFEDGRGDDEDAGTEGSK